MGTANDGYTSNGQFIEGSHAIARLRSAPTFQWAVPPPLWTQYFQKFAVPIVTALGASTVVSYLLCAFIAALARCCCAGKPDDVILEHPKPASTTSASPKSQFYFQEVEDSRPPMKSAVMDQQRDSTGFMPIDIIPAQDQEEVRPGPSKSRIRSDSVQTQREAAKAIAQELILTSSLRSTTPIRDAATIENNGTNVSSISEQPSEMDDSVHRATLDDIITEDNGSPIMLERRRSKIKRNKSQI
jgi:hypothetical protein